MRDARLAQTALTSADSEKRVTASDTQVSRVSAAVRTGGLSAVIQKVAARHSRRQILCANGSGSEQTTRPTKIAGNVVRSRFAAPHDRTSIRALA